MQAVWPSHLSSHLSRPQQGDQDWGRKEQGKVKKVNSTTKEDTDQEESDVDTIGRIKRIRVGAVAASPALMCGGGGNQAREMLQTNLDPVDSG